MKNLLQAELCSTLKRRQNGQNKKPNFVNPKNSTINAIYNQLKVLDAVEKAMSSEGESTNEKHANGITTSKASPVPERATTLPRPKTNTPADIDKPKMISHGRPNFVRPDPVFKMATAVPSQPTISPEPKQSSLNHPVNGDEAVKTVQRFKSISSIEPTISNNHSEESTAERSPQQATTKTMQTAQQFNCFTGHNKTTATNGQNYFQAVQEANIIKSVETEETVKCTSGASTVTMNAAHYSNSTAKSFTKLSHSTPTSGRSSPVLPTASPLPPRKLLTTGFKQQDALTSQSSTTTTVKTIEKHLVNESSTSSITFSDCSEQNEIQRKLQSLKTVDMHEVNRHISPAPTRKWTAKKSSQSPPLVTASPLPPRKAQPFKVQTQPQSPHITSPAIHHLNQHGAPNFDVKPIVSFSKDLCVTNRYPDQVKVLRSASSSSEAVSVSTKITSNGTSTSETKENTYFSDLKFIINENGEVIHSSSVTQQCH